MRAISSFFIAIAWLLLSTLPDLSYAKEYSPSIDVHTFENEFYDVFYFDDSDVILAHDSESKTVWRSEDAGKKWSKIEEEGMARHALVLQVHPWDNQRAYVVGVGRLHWMTSDQGKSWHQFNLQSEAPLSGAAPFKFHGRDPKKVIWNGEICHGLFSCSAVSLASDDDLHTARPLGGGMKTCYWAASTPMFAESSSDKVDDRVFCVKQGLESASSEDNRLVFSDDYFDEQELEPALESGRAVSGILSLAAVKKYVVAAAKSRGTDEMALYVTDDGSVWHRAIFGTHKVEQDAYTILESTNYSMQVDVMGASRIDNAFGYLYTSNSNGTYFTKNIDYTNRDGFGMVDFEKVANIQGIVLVNIVKNHEAVTKSASTPKIKISKISFNDGRDFEDLTCNGKPLHLHSVTDARQPGRVFSSPAPGIVMGVGNTGDQLKNYKDGDTYVSDDAGLTWAKALDGPHLFEFGNYGAVLVAVRDRQKTKEISYSLDHGKTWTQAKLDKTISPTVLTTVSDSTTLKFLLGGYSESDEEYLALRLDFEGLHERKCESKDFEQWSARVDSDGKPTCLMGHKQSYRRRKPDAECVIDDEFTDPEPKFEQCDCTDADFECDFNFVRSEDRKECIPAGKLQPPDGACKKEGDKFKGSSGWRLIPGNDCKRSSGRQKDDEIEHPCSDAEVRPPANDQIDATKYEFDASQFLRKIYLERSGTAQGDDETVIILTGDERSNQVHISHDHGKTWKSDIFKKELIVAIQQNPYFNDVVYFVTNDGTVHYTIDRGVKFHKFEAPAKAMGAFPMRFHYDYKDWMLWAGQNRDDRLKTDVYLSTDRGDNWHTLARYVSECLFVRRKEKDEFIMCGQHEDENPQKGLQLVSSENLWKDTQVSTKNLVRFATMREFIVVASRVEDTEFLKLEASLDGKEFAAAHFPRGFEVKQTGYDVLDSSTHAVFLHVTVNPRKDQEYGSIIKSNSNGTSYVMVLNAVNRDAEGYVDFEKMQGLEGVAMLNIVANINEVNKGERKKLKSMITHNDGAQWAWIPPPKQDSEGHDYACVRSANVASDTCSLHVHSYTERRDPSASFSSPSAIGLMIAVGNVGEYLESKQTESTETFITRDAGITWKSVRKGAYLYEYGDQGSIIVLVADNVPTKELFYTLDEGDSWQAFTFSEHEMEIYLLTTVPSDNAINFLLWGREKGSKKVSTVNIDFSNLKDRERLCELDEASPDSGDYTLWSPKHPLQDDNCLFGHIAQYHRKRTDAKCRNGKRVDHLHNILQNCTCTRQDFECDYNYELQADGSCGLVDGLSPPDHELRCKENPGKQEFWDVSGYRRIPLSTCQGGRELDRVVSLPCPGFEDEFNRKHGLSGLGLFFAVVLPVMIAGGVGYWVWKRYNEQGLGSFGAIRLGESLGSSSRKDSSWIAVPVAVIAGVVAVAKALPLLVSSLMRSAKGYVPVGSGSRGSGGRFNVGGPYRSRNSFANRRNVDPDADTYDDIDDELLGTVDEDAEVGDEV